jgi:hypothetical protein
MTTPDTLERSLRDLSAHLEWPPEPTLAASVVGRIEAAPTSRRSAVPRFGWSRLSVAAVFVATLVAVISGTLLLSPAARDAVADWLGVGGVRITFDDEVPRLGAPLGFGERVDAARAEDLATFDLRVPTIAGLGGPDEYYVDRRIPGGSVSFVYEATVEYPPAPGTEVGLLVTQFRGGIHEQFLKKVLIEETTVSRVVVDGGEGLWLGGEPHYLFRDADGGAHEEEFRMAGNTLLWERDGITYRLESALGRAESIAIANSFE